MYIYIAQPARVKRHGSARRARPGGPHAWYSADVQSIKVSTKHQVSLPSAARRRLGIEPGDRLSVEVRGDALILRRRPHLPSERLRGLGREVWQGVDPVGYVRTLRDESDQRHER
jgi:AbrB family looped-hinge helix DNA binding protein